MALYYQSQFNRFSFLIIVIFLHIVDTNALDTKWKPERQIRQLPNAPGENLNPTPPPKSIHKHVVVVTLESPPFMMKRSRVDVEGGVNETAVEWYGYCMDFFQELVKHLPYEVTYEIYQVSDNKFGSKSKHVVSDNANGREKKSSSKKLEKWNGLVGDLYYGRADLALAPLAVMAERELVIDFTVPFYDLVGIQILLKRPEVPQDWFKFLTVLDQDVWYSITIAFFITSFVIFLFDRLSPYSHKNMQRIQKLKQSHRLDHIKDPKSRPMINTMIGSEISQDTREVKKENKSSGDHLAKSHHLFVGSMVSPSKEVQRKSSALIFQAPDSVFNKRNDSIYPREVALDNGNRFNRWQARGSRTLGDYLGGINIRKNESSWDTSEEAEGSDVEGDGKPDFGLRDSLWFCITSLTPQGGGEAPQNLSGRVVAGAWWLFCFIILASYTANLAAFLTVSRLDIPIESLDDLAKQYRIKYAPIDGTAEQTYFERMAYIEEIFYNIWKAMSLNDSLSDEERAKFAVWDYPISDKYTRIWAQIQQVGMPLDIQEGIKRVKSSSLDDGFALLADANTVRHAVMTDCIFKAVGDEFSRKPIALGVRKGEDQFKDDLSYATLQLINQRFMEILREKWWTNNPNRVICDSNDESEGISIKNIGGVFIIIFAGVVLSFVVWLIERLIYKTKIGISQNLIQQS